MRNLLVFVYHPEDEVPEPSPSLSSVREDEVVVIVARVVPDEGFPNGSENEAGSEH